MLGRICMRNARRMQGRTSSSCVGNVLNRSMCMSESPLVGQSRNFLNAKVLQPRGFASLAKVLKSELQEEKGNCVVDENLTALEKNVKTYFKIEDKLGNMDIILKGKYKDEIIEVKFNAEDEIDLSNDEEEFEEEEIENEETVPAIPFVVTISRSSGKLMFECLASEVLTVERISHLTNGMDEADAYSGPVFDELDPSLQEAFISYLNDRHVDNSLAEFISLYAEMKEQKEYVGFLEFANSFVQDK